MRAEEEREYVAYLHTRLSRLHRAAYLLCDAPHVAEDLVQATGWRSTGCGAGSRWWRTSTRTSTG